MSIETKSPQDRDNNPLLQGLIRDLRGGPAAWGSAFKDLGRRLNFQPDYIQSSSESFRDLRENLNTRAGILISNHPSALDMCFIFPALQRSDLLLMVQEKRFEFLATALGPEHVVQASSDPKELPGITDRILNHIKTGGLFVIFPSGGEEVQTNELHFRSGFRHLVSKLDPDNMVYSFFIDPAAGKRVTNEVIGPPRGATDRATLIAPNLHVRPLRERLTVKVNETCSNVSEWQEIIANSTQHASPEKNNLLAKHFLEKTAFPAETIG